METYHPPKEVEENENNSDLPEKEVISEKWLLEKIDSLIPLIKEKWPNITRKKDAPADADDFTEEKEKLDKYFSENSGTGD